MIEKPYVGQAFTLTDKAVKNHGEEHKDRVYTVSRLSINERTGKSIMVICDEVNKVFFTSEIDAVTGDYPLVRLVKTDDGNLRINLRDRKIVQEIADDEETGWHDKERRILDYWLCNGWDEVPAEIMGLTSASFYSDSVKLDPNVTNDDVITGFDRVYTDFQYYAVRSWVEDLLRDGYAILHGYSEEDCA